jgi:serine/threonine protein phosphatase PrpC
MSSNNDQSMSPNTETNASSGNRVITDEVASEVVSPEETGPPSESQEDTAVTPGNGSVVDETSNETQEQEPYGVIDPTEPLTEQADQFSRPSIEQIKMVQIAEPYIEVAKRCNLGIVRQRNEDAMFSFVALNGGLNATAPFAVALVADGMGGHHGGDQASRMVSRMVGQQAVSRIYLPLLQDNSPPPFSEVMLEAVEMANQALYTPDPDKEGGTTLTAVLIVGQRLFLVHVGDSRAYLLNEVDDTFEALTTDHTIVQRLQDAGHITAEEAETHPHRNLIYRAMTGHELEIDTYTRSLPVNGKILICSDGLSGSISAERLEEIMKDKALSSQAQVDLLVEAALLGGSSDNITAVVVNFGY